jgi:hypothetical protein
LIIDRAHQHAQDRQRDPRSPDRQALLLVDDDNVNFRVIDLDKVQRALRFVERSRARVKPIARGFLG